jgi:glycosyltransferase involved in cell wall biosynthesis
MQLGGQRQQVSCVVPCRDELDALRRLLPLLADTLTECGYPWEVLLVDAGSQDGSLPWLQPWCRIPGFRLGAFCTPVSRARAVREGLRAARGDAVIVLEPGDLQALTFVQAAIERWDCGAACVCVGRAHARQPLAFRPAPPPLQLPADLLHDGSAYRSETGGLVLLARPVVQALMRET